MEGTEYGADAEGAEAEELPPYVPQTPLGRRLMAIREQILASGQPLLESWEDLEREIAERRGGAYLDDPS
ncbi:MAG: hypothetical protein ACRDJW_07980 [Thermomicrobiales bacterium]